MTSFRRRSNLLITGSLLSAAALAGDPEGKANLAADGKLPAGPGFAAAFPADAGIAKHPDVIFADDFETGGL